MRLNTFKVKCKLAELGQGVVAFSSAIGCQHSTLKKAIEGHDVTIQTVHKIAEGLGVSPGEIIANEKDSEYTDQSITES